MSISRRNFVRAGSVSVLLAAGGLRPAGLLFAQSKRDAGAAGPFAVPYEAKVAPEFYFTRDTFAPHLNTPFRFVGRKGGSYAEATLVGVFDFQAQARGRKSKTHGGECFSLTFESRGEHALPQGTYKMEHGALGRFSLLVVPSSPADGITRYEAVINHLG
jgi:hypothetical protein